jgi:apolipoprotein N-acyltransferase
LRQPWLRERLPSIGFFGEGSGPMRIETTTPSGMAVALGPLICSESLSASHAIETARLGVDVLLNIGSDGWFGTFGEPQFHLAIARLRSVETRLPQVRAANTGISAILLPGGEIARQTEVGVEATLDASVPLASLGPTLFVRWGDWFGSAALVGGIVLLLALVGPRRSAGK